jgi:hypothetical protein
MISSPRRLQAQLEFEEFSCEPVTTRPWGVVVGVNDGI